MDVAAIAREPSRSPAPQDRAVVSDPIPDATNKIDHVDNKFQKAISAWRSLSPALNDGGPVLMLSADIDFTTLIPSLDTTASDLVTQQRDALVERKDLAQKTKDFRRLDDSVKLGEVKGLLKAYQSYIDLVSNHNKTVSNAFLQAYSSLSEAPDPYPLLEASVDSLLVADETVPKLEADNAHLHSTIAKLTSQLEGTERRLQYETQTRQELQETSDSKIEEVKASWSAVLTEKQDNWSAREKSLEERAENQERLLKELKASYEVSQRLDSGHEAEDGSARGGPTSAELEITTSELERANLRLADLEARNEQFRLELAQSATQKSVTTRSTAVEDEPAYLRLRAENSSLLRKVDAARYERESERRDLENSLRALRREVTALKEDGGALKTKLHKWNDYDDVKRELEVLKSIEFTTGENQDDVDVDEHAGGGKKRGQDLEQLLLARNKKLNNKLTILRVSHRDLDGRLQTLQEDLTRTNAELEKSRSLTSTLENDLSRVQQDGTQSQAAMSVAGTYSSRYPVSSHARRGGRASPTSSIISGFETPERPMNNFEALRAGGEPVGGGSGILPMIVAQRDRFKKKNTEMESELTKTYQTVSSLRSEVASLQKDNLSLYEKTRYVSTYKPGDQGARTASPSLNPNPSTVQLSSNDGGPLSRYKSAYESRISPFAAFRGQESNRAVKRMSLPERALLQVTKVIFANRTSRNLFALYLLSVHLVLFVMIFSSGGGRAEAQMASKLTTRAVEIAEQAVRDVKD